MPAKVVYTIDNGQKVRICYRPFNSAGPYTCLNDFPGPEESPYTFSLPSSGDWEIQVTTICPNCSGNNYSDPVISMVTEP